jgi:hypothetical protein
MSILGGITRPVTNMAEKAAKAGQIKKISLKIKMKPGKSQQKADPESNAS